MLPSRLRSCAEGGVAAPFSRPLHPIIAPLLLATRAATTKRFWIKRRVCGGSDVTRLARTFPPERPLRDEHTITVRKRHRGSAPAREPEAQAKGAPPRDRLCASARCCRCFAPGAAVSSPTAVDPLVPAAGYEQAETRRGAPPSTRGPWSLALARQAGLEAKLRDGAALGQSPAVLPEEP